VYHTTSTSKQTAAVDDIWIDPPKDESQAITRKVLRAQIIDNSGNKHECVKIRIVHQRRHAKSNVWQDFDSFSLTTVKAGCEVNLQLTCAETFRVFEELKRLFRLGAAGVPRGEHDLEVVDRKEAVIVKGPAREILQKLLERAGDELWTALKELDPHLFKATALLKLQELREQAVHEFKEHLNADDWEEPDWQTFFQQNTWIFGYGLSFQFLSTLQPQAHYGGTTLSGKGAQKGDFLMKTEAEKRITVLVEIKKPSTALVFTKPYRNGACMISGELAGAISQIQANCRTWEMQGATQPQNADALRELRIFTIQPKGILVIGRTSQLTDRAKQESFELFRRNLQNPEIVTFDELLERARHLLLNEREQFSEPPEDDVPF
jgi:Domain of unknown function (DUF4263)